MSEKTSGPRRSRRSGRVGIKDVAEHAGVSVTTVSNVLNSTNRISERTTERVEASIRALGYVRNSAAHELRSGRSTAIGLIVPDGGNPFYAEVARAAEDAAAALGSAVLVGNSNEDPERELRYLDLFQERGVRGILMAPTGDVADRVQLLRQRDSAVVVLGRIAQPIGCTAVSIDNLAGGYQATRHVIDQGRSRLAFIGSPATPGVADRWAGAQLAVAESPSVTLQVIEPEGLSVSAGKAVGERMLAGIDDGAERPDGVICANDLLAIGMVHALHDRAAIPDEIAIIGYDDIDFAASAIVPLSSVQQPAALIGRTAVKLLNDELAEAEHAHSHHQVLFPPELVIRQSTVARP